MALERKTADLVNSLSTKSPNHRSIKRQLETISWLPLEESSRSQIEDVSLIPILEDLSSDESQFPSDIQLEARRLLARWARGVYGPPFCTKAKRTTAPGDHGFVSGDCWPSRKTMFYEGCHGTMQSGIHGDKNYGAYSIVANGVYDNRDKGDTIWYAGTNPKQPGEATLYTERLIGSFNTANPVRVIRGAKGTGLTFEPLAPAKGFRYDGLYRVEEYGPPAPVNGVQAPEGTYEFLLVRLPDQPPIQYKDGDKRPDNESLAQWHNHRLYERKRSGRF